MSERCQPSARVSSSARTRFTRNTLRTAIHTALLLGLSSSVVPVLAATDDEAAAIVASGGDLELPETQVKGSADAADLPQVYAGGQVATGSKVGLMGNKDFMETPFSTISYTDEYIRNGQAQDISAVIGRTDPSVNVAAKHSIFETFFIRGFPTSSDDVTYNGLVGMAPNMRTSTELAERIEVLKGPSALLNGMPPGGSVAGSVNMVPKRAADEPLTRLTGTYESDGLWGTHADVGRRFGDNNEFGIRYNGVYRKGDTAVDDQDQKMEISSLGLDWRAERFRLSLDMYQQRELLNGANYFGISAISPNVTHIPGPKKGDHSLAPDWSYVRTETDTFLLRGEYDISDNLTAYAAWGQRDGGYNALIARNTLLNNEGDIGVGAIRSIRDGTQKSGEVGLKGTFDTGPVNHSWALAATRFKSEWSFKDGRAPSYIANYDKANYGSKPTFPGYGSITQYTEAELESVALLDTLSFWDDRIQWTLGARHQNIKSANLTGQKVKTSKYDESRLSPATAILFKATDEISLYANYIEGLSQGQSAPTTAENSGEMMSPYRTKQYEIGAKFDLGSFSTSVALFEIKKPSSYLNTATNVYGTYGEQRNRGVEWSFFGEATANLRLMGGISYTKAELTKALDKTTEGNQITGVPKVIAKAGAEYDLDAIPGLTLTAGANYTDGRYVTDDHRLELPSYTVYDIGARYSTKVMAKPVTLSATVQNVTNKAYWLGSYQGGDGTGLSGGLGAPRTLQVSATVDF
ncbi:TonB-dependent receptor [Ectopseudomonas mendocina]|uniref:TonB-dependent receptor n=1 Tax=Ectopseudomonas mendocina TaxID=300 RepID=A0ABZ2RPB5_ECTME